MGLGGFQTWVQILLLPFPPSVTLDKAAHSPLAPAVKQGS